MKLANRILEMRGFGNQRVNMYWLSGAEAEKFVKSVEDALTKVEKIGPNPINVMNSKLEIKEKKMSVASLE